MARFIASSNGPYLHIFTLRAGSISDSWLMEMSNKKISSVSRPIATIVGAYNNSFWYSMTKVGGTISAGTVAPNLIKLFHALILAK